MYTINSAGRDKLCCCCGFSRIYHIFLTFLCLRRPFVLLPSVVDDVHRSNGRWCQSWVGARIGADDGRRGPSLPPVQCVSFFLKRLSLEGAPPTMGRWLHVLGPVFDELTRRRVGQLEAMFR